MEPLTIEVVGTEALGIVVATEGDTAHLQTKAS